MDNKYAYCCAPAPHKMIGAIKLLLSRNTPTFIFIFIKYYINKFAREEYLSTMQLKINIFIILFIMFRYIT